MKYSNTTEDMKDRILLLNSMNVNEQSTNFLNGYISENTRLENGIPLFVSETTGKTQRYNYYACTFKKEFSCQSKISVCTN